MKTKNSVPDLFKDIILENYISDSLFQAPRYWGKGRRENEGEKRARASLSVRSEPSIWNKLY